MTPAEKVREWPRDLIELWVERSGIRIDSGASQFAADEGAYRELLPLYAARRREVARG